MEVEGGRQVERKKTEIKGEIMEMRIFCTLNATPSMLGAFAWNIYCKHVLFTVWGGHIKERRMKRTHKMVRQRPTLMCVCVLGASSIELPEDTLSVFIAEVLVD